MEEEQLLILGIASAILVVAIEQLRKEKAAPVAVSTSVSATIITASNKMSANDAYNGVQKGQWANVKTKMVSRYYSWDEVLNAPFGSTAPAKIGKLTSVPQSTYQNAASLAAALDKLCDKAGKKLHVNTWVRWGDGGHHGTGKACDLGNARDSSLNYSYINTKLKPLARTIAEFKGIGYPTKSSHNSLHLDIGSHGITVPWGKQYVFVDNGDGNYSGSLLAVASGGAA